MSVLNAGLGVGRGGRAVNAALRAAHRRALPGVALADLEAEVRAALARHGARPAMLGYADAPGIEPFPAACAIGLNQVITAPPDPARRLEPGDLVTVDVAAERDGWHADAAISWVISGPADGPRRGLAAASARVTGAGVRAIRAGVDWAGVVGAMSAEAARLGAVLLPGFDGHAVGRSLHAPPRLPNHPDDLAMFPPVRLTPGMVVTVEPVVAPAGSDCVRDGWADRTADGSDACFTEATVLVGPPRPGRPGSAVLAGFPDGWFA